MTIKIPLALLRTRLSGLISAIVRDWAQEQLIETPEHLPDDCFDRSKIMVLGHREHSAVILATEYVLAHESIQASQLVETNADWDMEEDAYPILREWRRRWWSQLTFPHHWVDDVEITDETMGNWHQRKETKDELPPYIPVRSMDVRHGVSAIGWNRDAQGEGWQRLHWIHRDHDLVLPPDAVLVEELTIQIVVAWINLSSNLAVPTLTTPPKPATTLAADALAAGLPGCAALFNALAAHPERPETAAQLRVAQALLEAYQAEPSTSQR